METKYIYVDPSGHVIEIGDGEIQDAFEMLNDDGGALIRFNENNVYKYKGNGEWERII
jgi:hypothetical protein